MFWKEQGLVFKGFAKQRLKSDKSVYTIYCHKGTSLKDKKNYCGFTFLARCPFDKNSAEWHNPDNWTYVRTKKARQSHRFISTESQKLNKNLKLRLKSDTCCNVPKQLLMINKFNRIYKEKCTSGTDKPIEQAFNQLKMENENEVDMIVESEILSAPARHLKNVQKTWMKTPEMDIVDDLPRHCRYIEGLGQFYDPGINAGLKNQKFFMLKSPEMDELLKTCDHFSFDATFSTTGWTQLGVLTAHVPNKDPFRQKSTVTVAFGFERSKEKTTYVEFFQTFKEKQ